MEITFNTAQKQTDYKKNQKDDTNTNDSFSKQLDEANQNSNEESVKTQAKSTQQLIEELMFIFRTGISKEEFEKLQELLKELKEKIKEGNYSQKEVEELLSQAEQQIMLLKKSITGEAIKEMSDSMSELKELKGDNTQDTSTISELLTRIEESLSELKDLELGKDKKGHTNNLAKELELLQTLRESGL